METMIKFKNIDVALEKFIESAIRHAEATEQGDFRKANKNYKTIANVIAYLKEHSEILKLSELLNNSNEGVKVWAATYLLPIKEQEAIRALEEISKGSGIRSFAAKTTLSEWKKGNLKL